MLSKQFLRSVQLKQQDLPASDSYPFNLAAVKALDHLDFHPKVTFIIAESI